MFLVQFRFPSWDGVSHKVDRHLKQKTSEDSLVLRYSWIFRFRPWYFVLFDFLPPAFIETISVLTHNHIDENIFRPTRSQQTAIKSLLLAVD